MARDAKRIKVEMLQTQIQDVNDELEKVALKVKHHEDNIKTLRTGMSSVSESICDMEVILEKHYPLSKRVEEEQTIEQILNLEHKAATLVCEIKAYHSLQAFKLSSFRDVLGVVALLGKVKDDNLSSLLSEFLGLETMLAIVCKTHEGVKALEKYDNEGRIDKDAGLHGLGPSLGRLLQGRFHVICLENLRPYTGELLPGDPEKKLALLEPRLNNGELPPGFCGFAVNMINVGRIHLSCLTASGHGLRETLFYSLFARSQVYDTRAHMLDALPCISDGAISLDGGIVRSSGLFFLGGRENVNVKFPISLGISPPPEVIVIEEKIMVANDTKKSLTDELHREEQLLNKVKESYYGKKKELLELLNTKLSDTGHSNGKGFAE